MNLKNRQKFKEKIKGRRPIGFGGNRGPNEAPNIPRYEEQITTGEQETIEDQGGVKSKQYFQDLVRIYKKNNVKIDPHHL